LQENKKLQRELEVKEDHLSSIRSTVQAILKNDTDFCGNDDNVDVDGDEDLVQMVNSVLCQFGKSKQRHLKDVKVKKGKDKV